VDCRRQGQPHPSPRPRPGLARDSKKNSTPLLDGIDQILKQCGQEAGSVVADRIRCHLLSHLVCLGRHTVTGLLGTAGRQFKDWTADYRLYSHKRVNVESLFQPIRRTLAAKSSPAAPAVVALDDTRLRKTGTKTPGVAYVRDPLGPPFHVNFIKAQRFIQLSMALSTDDQGQARMIPVDLVHAPAPKKPSRRSSPEERAQFRKLQRQTALAQVGAHRITRLRQDLDRDGHCEKPLWTVVDGSYTNGTLLKQLPPRTELIGRIRSDAKLYYLPEQEGRKSGRKKVYGPLAPTPEQARQENSIPWLRVSAFAAGKIHSFRIKTIAPLRWRSAGQRHDLRLIVIAPLAYRISKESRLCYRRPAYLICTNPHASLEEVLQAYLWRWDIEVNFRDEKTLLGVGEAQVRHINSVEAVPALAVAAYAALLIAAIEKFGATGVPTLLPLPKWRNHMPRRATTQCLINHLRAELWSRAIHFSDVVNDSSAHTKPQKYSVPLASALFYGAMK
jgi:DDE superfamily endonuclease